MVFDFENDRAYLENKYHKVGEPFNPYNLNRQPTATTRCAIYSKRNYRA